MCCGTATHMQAKYVLVYTYTFQHHFVGIYRYTSEEIFGSF